MKKKLVKFIALGMTTVMLAACGSTGNGPAEGGGNVVTPPENGSDVVISDATDYWGNPIYDEYGRPLRAGFTEVPMNLRGRNIHVLTASYFHFNYWLLMDETPNETLSVIQALRQIEQDYNMTFSFDEAPRGGAAVDRLIHARLIGEQTYDIFNINIFHTAPDNMFRQGVLLEMNHPQIAHIIDFENNPWHYGSLMSQMAGRQHGVHFAVANSGQILNSVLTFNRDHMETFSLGNLYEMVFNHTWNFNTFESILHRVSIESHGTVLPLVTHREQFVGPGFIFANGGELIRNTPEGLVFVGHENDNALEALAFLRRLYENDLLHIMPGNHPSGDTIYEMLQRAAHGEIMFMSGEYELLRMLTRQEVRTNHAFGLLPTPMGEHMDDYVAAMIRYDMFYIVRDVASPEEVAAILVAMANRLTRMDVLEHELNYGVQDEYSAIILEMMLDRLVIDYSRMTSTRNEVTNFISNIIRGIFTPIQAMQMIEPAMARIIESLVLD